MPGRAPTYHAPARHVATCEADVSTVLHYDTYLLFFSSTHRVQVEWQVMLSPDRSNSWHDVHPLPHISLMPEVAGCGSIGQIWPPVHMEFVVWIV